VVSGVATPLVYSRRLLRESLDGRREPEIPWVAATLAISVLVTAVVTGVFAYDISPQLAARGSFGLPALEAHRWWTVGASFFLTRDWFMASTMPICLFISIGLYERRAGHARALAVAVTGHVTGSIIVALAFAPFALTHVAMLVRAAHNLDFGGSMAIAAACGALASRLGHRRAVWVVALVVVLALPLHHQMSDWGHFVAAPAGFLADRVRRPAQARVALVLVVLVTVGLTWFGTQL
jgi:phosphatidylglycerol lysyltransferase